MNEINFLPLRLIQSQRRQSRMFRELLVVGGVLLCCVVWYGGQQGHNASLEHLVVAKQDELVAAQQRTVEVQRLTAQREDLQYQLQIQQRLTRPITHSTLLAVMTDLLPDSLAITELTLVAQTPVSQPRHQKGQGAKTSRKASPPKPQLMHVQIEGVSPSDVDVANLVGGLSEHPIFSNVKMRYSRAVKLQHVQARQFRVEMDILLDRRYLPMKAQNQEMADAN